MKKSKLCSRIVSWFRNVRLGYKLAIVYALSGFLPVVAVLSVTYVQMKQILLQNERDSMESYLYQALASMENKLAIYTNLNNYICYNQTISQVIGYQYDSVYEMYNQLVTILDPMLASLKYFHNDVGKVTIYVDKDMIKHGDTLAPISEIIDTNWYRSVADSGEMQWFVDKNEEKEILSHMPHCISARWHPTFCDISPIGGTKQLGIDKFLEYYGLDLKDTMAFGDGGNDMQMLQHVSLAVAMGNAGDELKSIADFVTKGVDDEGIAYALKHYGLIDL